mmetsp:Transcript_3274/g.6179  ORF Transcript_3274/g.6179 Transcript_3274/m.6179 type:complete len:565 (-) Transcript_3274:367-2061(-)
MKRKAQSETVNGNENNGGNGNLKDTKLKKAKEAEDDAGNDCDGDGVTSSPPDASTNRPAPKYGSKEYWEARYKSHLPGVVVTPEEANGSSASKPSNEDIEKYENTNTGEASYVLDGQALSKEATKPGHEWYFSYDELRPLILPLILGNPDNEIVEGEFDDDEDCWVEEEEECDDDDEGEGKGKEDCEKESFVDGDASENESHRKENDSNNKQPTSDEGKAGANKACADSDAKSESAQEDIEEAKYDCKADLSLLDTDATKRRPKKVLEVGCGDMPLGTSLASELTSMQHDTGLDAKLVVDEVTCIDYSEIVVQSLINEQNKEQEKEQSTLAKKDNVNNGIQPTFAALDARSLPYASNTYDLILEKGTLDAMLSDAEEGLSNCVKIVKEMARVTNEGGAILIVSHLNANESKGVGWLEDVVFRGLKDEFHERHKKLLNKEKNDSNQKKTSEVSDDADDEEREYVWSVEVHGGEGKVLDANGEEIEGDAVDENTVPIYGPAVYIVRKKGVPASIARELFGKKKKENNSEEGDKEEDGAKKEEEQIDDDEDLMEMPPVKLEFMTYED